MRRLRRYLLISVLFFTSVSLCAGESSRSDADSSGKHKISFAYGFGSLYVFGLELGHAFGSLFADPVDTSSSHFGPLSLSYEKLVTKHVALGIVFSYAKINMESIYSDLEVVRDEYNLYMLAPKLLLTWGGNVLSVYHGISLGVGISHVTTEESEGERRSELHFGPAVHVFLVGFNLRFADTVSLFADVGGGYLGSLNVGVGIHL
jgi:hypothetical protein